MWISTSTINLLTAGVPWRTPAWKAISFDGLTDPDVRGSNRILPGSGGVIVHPRRRTESTRSIHMHFYGHQSPAGLSYDDPHAGLEANLDLFREKILDPDLGVLIATLVKADGSEWEGRVQPISPMRVTYESPSKARCVVTLVLPDGQLFRLESS